jgi:hypothetical protein
VQCGGFIFGWLHFFPSIFMRVSFFSFPRFIHIFLSKGSLQLKGQKLFFFFLYLKGKIFIYLFIYLFDFFLFSKQILVWLTIHVLLLRPCQAFFPLLYAFKWKKLTQSDTVNHQRFNNNNKSPRKMKEEMRERDETIACDLIGF